MYPPFNRSINVPCVYQYLPFILSSPLFLQARRAGTLDSQVFSLQARRERFQALDLIPPEYTFQAASAAVLAAQPPPNSSAPAQPSSSARPTNVKASKLPAGTKRGGTSSFQAKGRRVRPRLLDTEVKRPSLAECRSGKVYLRLGGC
jgi:hypothetical protein